jgi:uncharacterized membrane protein YbhN (UPF0104 family)
VVAVAGLVGLVMAPETGRRWARWLTRHWSKGARIADRGLEIILTGLEGVRSPRHAIPLLAWSVMVWLIAVLPCWALFQGMELELPPIAAWTVLAFVGLGVSVPSAPGYIGVWHAAATLALGIFGVPQSVALGYAIVFHATQFVPVTLLGWLFLLREHVTLGEARRAAVTSDAG